MLAAVWISLALHAAVIALVQVAPPAAVSQGEPAIEARLVSTSAAPPAAEPLPLTPEVQTVETPAEPVQEMPLLAPSEVAEALPVVDPVPVLPAEPAPPVAAALPANAVVEAPKAEPAAAPPSAPAPAPAPVAVITTSVDLTYYSARDLDRQPRALRDIVPDYPHDADRQRLSGTVRLQLKLEADGRVSDIEIVSATPPDVFNESAIKAFRDALFAPAQKHGRPVRARVLIEVVYDWEGRR